MELTQKDDKDGELLNYHFQSYNFLEPFFAYNLLIASWPFRSNVFNCFVHTVLTTFAEATMSDFKLLD